MTDEMPTRQGADPVRRQIGQNVKAELIRAGVEQQAVAALLGVTASQVTRRIAGTIGFEAAELVRIAELLGIPAGRLVEVAPQAAEAGVA